MRTIIELPGDQIQALDAVCKRERISRAEAIRRAVTLLLAQQRGAATGAAFGVWRDRAETGMGYQRRLRGEWQDALDKRSGR